jgi:uncharacterized membrane protein
MKIKNLKPYSLSIIIAVTIFIFFSCSSFHHITFGSTAYDLGIFDQSLYLMSKDVSPFSSILDFHILGDHASFILYVISFFYKVYPSIYWLFAIQAISLVIGAIPTKYLALNAGMKESQSNIIAISYLLHPVIFNINLFDFHPDVIAVPALIWAILSARKNCSWHFFIAIILVLSCKAVFALTAAGMGFWLLFFEKKRLYGGITIFLGVVWFAIAVKIIIPFFGQSNADLTRHLHRYETLGQSFPEVINNLIHHPQIFLAAIINFPNAAYLFTLFLPFIVVISPRHLTSLVSIIPALAMNLLSSDPSQKDIIHQYSLPILPFLLVAVISTLANKKGIVRSNRLILAWSIFTFVTLSNFFHFDQLYLNSLDTLQSSKTAIAQINSQDGVMTTNNFAPHLTHRKIVKLPTENVMNSNLEEFKYILLDRRHPGFMSSPKIVETLLNRLQDTPEFKLKFDKDSILLFEKSE